VIPPAWIDRGDVKRADTLEALAALCGIDPVGLRATIVRFNPNAAVGIDPDFGRGQNVHNRHRGDPGHKPNGCLAPIERPPFWAAAIYPGDVGTRGGILCDEHARALDPSGEPVPGLYAAGNAAATVMGGLYLGAGCGIGNAAVFGYVAGLHIGSV